MSDFADHAVAIANLKARYCAAADLSATDVVTARLRLAEIFTEDFVGDYGVGPLIGPQAIIDFLCEAIAGNSEWMIHMLHSPCIEIADDSATGDWTVMARMKRRSSGSVDTVVGRYHDVFRRTPEGWRIEKVTFERHE